MIDALSKEEARLLPTPPRWNRGSDLRKLPLAIAKLAEPETSKVVSLINSFRLELNQTPQVFIYSWISQIAFGLNDEETRKRHDGKGISTLPGPSSADVLPLGIVSKCVKLVRCDIYDYGAICLDALRIIECLARVVRDEQRSSLIQQLHESGWLDECTLVCRLILPASWT